MNNLKFELPKEKSSIIKVIGVGGGGGNAVNHMFREGIKGVDFIIANTDRQALESSPIPNKMQIGGELTDGRGAGSNPEVGKLAAETSIEGIVEKLGINTQMLFVTAGMGGGTGTGAAPVIAKVAKDLGILTIGIVTTPFKFEGSKRCNAAIEGIKALEGNVDSILIISNDKIKEMYGNLNITQAFCYADNVLATAAKGIAEIITLPGQINVDFEDVKTAMRNSGAAIMGTGLAEGEGRALKAAEEALNSPLLNDNRIYGASDILVNITYGDNEVTLDEYSEVNEYLQDQAGMNANLKCGLCYDQALGNKVSVTVMATGFNRLENTFKISQLAKPEIKEEIIIQSLEEEALEIPEILNPIENDMPKPIVFEDITEDEPKQVKISLETNKEIHFSETLNNKKNQELHDRWRQLKEISERSKTENGREMLESVPAYARQNVKLEPLAPSSESSISRYILNNDGEKKPELRANNSFLHDNVD